MTCNDIAKKLDKYITWNMTNFCRKSERAYQMQKPTYFMGLFEAYYQITYYIIDDYNLNNLTLQDVIDFAIDDINYVYRKFGKEIYTNKYYYGYYIGMQRFIDYMIRLKVAYYETTDNPLRHIMSCIYVHDVLACL